MSKIANIEEFNRPREKALSNGISSLTDKELLAIFIRCGTKDFSALEIAELVLNKYGSLTSIFNADLYSIMKIKGIKKAKAVELMAIIELSKRISKENGRRVASIKEAEDVYNLLKVELENEMQEHFIAIFLNIKLKIIKKESLFLGGDSSSLVDVNLLFKKAISCGAKRIICIHNHPSGDPFPSKDDIELTEKIRKVAKITNIELLDHIIIGKNDYFSFSQMKV